MAREGWSLRDLFAELKRRRVFRVAAAYAAVGFVLVQAAAYVFDALLFPEWAHRMLVVFLLFGFPVALLLAWAFEITPEGVRPTPEWGSPGDGDGTEGQGEGAVGTRLAVVAGVVLVMTVLVAGTGWAVWTAWLAPEEGRVPAAAAADAGGELDPRRIAVLPFEDHSREKQLGHIAQGFTEALIHELSQAEGLDVISRYGVRPFRASSVSVDSVARVLGAGSVVQGSVERDGEDLLVTVQLVDGVSSSHIASQRVRGRVDAPLDLRNQLVGQVADILRREMGEEVRLREARTATESSRAWELYHMGMQLGEGADSLAVEGERGAARRLYREADSLLSLAEEADEDWVAPIVERGWTARNLARLGDPSVANAREEALRKGLGHAERALTIAPEAAEAFTLRGSLLYYLARASRSEEGAELYAQAERDLRKAVALDPDQAEAWARLSYVYHRQGRFAEARWALRRCREADAFLLSPRQYLNQAAQLALDLRDLEAADSLTEAALEQAPREAAFMEKRLLYLASAASDDGHVAEAWSLLGRFEEQASVTRWDPGRLMVAGVLARAGLADSARSVMGTVEMGEGVDPPHWYFGAYVSLQLGDTDRALELLARYAEAVPAARAYLAREWWWDPVREDPRFQRLVPPADAGERISASPRPDG